MNAVINTLVAMMNGSDQQTIDQGIASARSQHDRYLIELARVLGLTIEPANAAPLRLKPQVPNTRADRAEKLSKLERPAILRSGFSILSRIRPCQYRVKGVTFCLLTSMSFVRIIG